MKRVLSIEQEDALGPATSAKRRDAAKLLARHFNETTLALGMRRIPINDGHSQCEHWCSHVLPEHACCCIVFCARGDFRGSDIQKTNRHYKFQRILDVNPMQRLQHIYWAPFPLVFIAYL